MSVIVAFDNISSDRAAEIAELIVPEKIISGVKLSSLAFGDHFCISSMNFIGKEKCHKEIDIFVDMKISDSAKTSLDHARRQIGAGASIISVHVSAGWETMKAVADFVESYFKDFEDIKKPLITAVTVPTYFSEKDCLEIYSRKIYYKTLQFTEMALDAGLKSIVCSPNENGLVRKNFGNDLIIINPGIRLPGSAAGCHKRFDTPDNALKSGANFLVIGSPITEAKDPLEAVKEISKHISIE